MKYHIINIAVAFSLLAAVCLTLTRSTVPLPNSSILVWSRNDRLEAWLPHQLRPVPLRKIFLKNAPSPPNWHLSSDGSRLVFSEFPRDVDFFDASASRRYVFLASPNTRASVFLAGYGPKCVDALERFNYYGASSLNSDASEVIVNEGKLGQFMQDPSPQWVAIYNIASRKRIFDSRALIAGLANYRLRLRLSQQIFFAPVLSPDGRDIICGAIHDYGDSVDHPQEPGHAPPFLLVHFDLEANSAAITGTVDDQLAFERFVHHGNTIDVEGPNREFSPQFAWHPQKKLVIFAGPASPDGPGRNLFTLDLSNQKVTRLTSGPVNDFSPQFSPDGKSIWWLRGEGAETELYSSDLTGKNAAPIEPVFKGADRIQFVRSLGDWASYSNLPVDNLAGPDK